MANIILNWTPNTNGNTINQRAYSRQKNLAGVFTTTNFSPTNDLSNAATTTTFTAATVNTVYEFKVANICTVGGPTFNSNGVVEGINFSCVTPTEVHDNTTATVTVSGLPADIIKVRFSLFNGATQVGLSENIAVSSGTAFKAYTGLSNSTAYTGKVQLIALVNGVEKTSSFTTCEVPFTTGTPTCLAPTTLSASCENCA